MPTTSIKLPDELKKRIAKVAKRKGESPHAFMVKAIAEQTDRAERRDELMTEALAARDEMDRTGLGYDGDEVHEYLRAVAAGEEGHSAEAQEMAKISYSRTIFADLERFARFAAEAEEPFEPWGLQELATAAEMIAHFPHLGRRVGEVREFVVPYGKSAFLVYYDFDAKADVVRMLGVRHSREEPSSEPK